MTRVLVTGGAGYIGSHTCVELVSRGYEPVIVDNFVNSSPKAIDRICQLTNSPVEWYEADVRDTGRIGEQEGCAGSLTVEMGFRKDIDHNGDSKSQSCAEYRGEPEPLS